jgi:hypothetical protein
LFTYPIEGCHWYSKPGEEAAPKQDDAIHLASWPWDQLQLVPPFRQKGVSSSTYYLLLLLKTSTPTPTPATTTTTTTTTTSQSHFLSVSPTKLIQRDWNQLEKLLTKANNNNNNKITTLPLRIQRERNKWERERERERGLWVGPERTNCGNNNDRES